MDCETLILGAGAAGMMAAAHAGPGVLVVDHARAPGEKIRISGGGRCNFTNLHTTPANFLSANPHFAKSALSRYTQHDFIALVEAHRIPWHEKTLGQLFCDTSAKDIIAMLRAEMERAGARLWLQTEIGEIGHDGARFRVALRREGAALTVTCRTLVVATGGKSIPKMGATGLGYRVATQFGLPVVTPRPGLVPLTFGPGTLADLAPMAGLAAPARVTCNGTSFDEALLVTHRGLSGPAILQISSYWTDGEPIALNLLPGEDALSRLRALRPGAGARNPETLLAELLPKRLAAHMVAEAGLRGNYADQSDADLARLAALLAGWTLTPSGSEGYRTAEVTLGGVDTAALSSRSMEARQVRGLHFIGECVDVTGWLGGYNFQWAWSSAWAAGTAIAARA